MFLLIFPFLNGCYHWNFQQDAEHRVKNIPFCLALDSVRKALRMPHLFKPDAPQFAFQFLVLQTELRVWCSSAWELLGYPPASLTFVNALYQNEDIIFLRLWLLAWFIWLSALCILTWLAGHGGVCIWIWGIWRRRQKDGVHSQAGCYIRAVSKAKGHHRKQTAHVHMPSSALPPQHMLDSMNRFLTCGTHWYFHLDLILHFT